MTDVPVKMTCEEFQSHLPDLIASGEDVSAHAHIQECELCRALYADLEAIAQAARELMFVDPPDTLWEKLEQKLKEDDPVADEEEPPLGGLAKKV